MVKLPNVEKLHLTWKGSQRKEGIRIKKRKKKGPKRVIALK